MGENSLDDYSLLAVRIRADTENPGAEKTGHVSIICICLYPKLSFVSSAPGTHPDAQAQAKKCEADCFNSNPYHFGWDLRTVMPSGLTMLLL